MCRVCYFCPILTKTGLFRRSLVKRSNIKFHEKLFCRHAKGNGCIFETSSCKSSKTANCSSCKYVVTHRLNIRIRFCFSFPFLWIPTQDFLRMMTLGKSGLRVEIRVYAWRLSQACSQRHNLKTSYNEIRWRQFRLCRETSAVFD